MENNWLTFNSFSNISIIPLALGIWEVFIMSLIRPQPSPNLPCLVLFFFFFFSDCLLLSSNSGQSCWVKLVSLTDQPPPFYRGLSDCPSSCLPSFYFPSMTPNLTPVSQYYTCTLSFLLGTKMYCLLLFCPTFWAFSVNMDSYRICDRTLSLSHLAHPPLVPNYRPKN